MKTSDKVKYILEKYPQTRDSDQSLISMVWWAYNQNKIVVSNGDSYVKLKDILFLEKPASIIRCRQKFQEEGLFLAKEKIQEKRKEYQEEMQQNISQYSWEYNEFLM